MIFVTVGTHEQPFDRLIKCIDKLKETNVITEEVIIQMGYSTYEPQYCMWSKLYPYQKMIELTHDARIVITHGGPSSFVMPLQFSKIPIVVPRMRKYGEHVNDHQVDFSKAVSERKGNIIYVEDVGQLGDIIQRYDKITQSMSHKLVSNNKQFNEDLAKIVKEMFD